MNKLPEIPETMNRIKKLEAERQELIEKLSRSLAIQEIWPKAFTLGKVTSYIHHVSILGMTASKALETIKFSIRAGEHEKTWPLVDVPQILQIFHLERALQKYVEMDPNHVMIGLMKAILKLVKE